MNKPDLLKKSWVWVILLLIILLAVSIRLIDYRWDYLRNIDSYAFYRHMDDIIANNGTFQLNDQLSVAPDGIQRSVELYPYAYLGAYSYMLTRVFVPNLQLWQFLIYFPAILAGLMAIPMYFIGKILYNRLAGLLAALFIVLDVSIFSRTLGGDPDTDAITLLVPLIIMAVFLFSYKYFSNGGTLNKRGIFYVILVGLLLGVWAHTWVGYWYIVWLIFGFLVLNIIKEYLSKRRDVGKRLLVLLIVPLLILELIFIIPFYGIDRATYTFTGPITFGQIKSEEGTFFPNVGVSIAELQSSGGILDVLNRIASVGSDSPIIILISPLFLMFYSFAYLTYSFIRKRHHFDTLILLLIWFIGPLLATAISIRFSILFSAPIAIGSAIFLSKLYRVIFLKEKFYE